ncbi:OmpA family protein [Acidiluteibacter ferrifornacis]|uniref:OmpA family protein n=1 Tax=Acidiluteibacter ferrifornacis TaxID=2692424 RepID=A0A6N9NIT4_9FLAO|nr:OmpA family protein [Acidiluteibacter ferrifornacis]NBG66588.1 OmpA family protein [Acidiluteibacter ferrifornacis]
MNYNKLVGLFFFAFIFSLNISAQKNFLEEADHALYKEGKYFDAIEMYKKAYTKEKGRDVKAEIIFKIAESYRLSDQAEQAEVWYDKAILARYNNPLSYLHLGEMKMLNGKYDEAIVQFKKYIAEVPEDPRGEQGVKSAQDAQKWKDQPTKYVVEPMSLLNSEGYDFSPTFADKNNEEIIFTSLREGATGSGVSAVTGQSFADLYVSSVDRKGKWSEPKLVEGINTESEEGSAVMNQRRNTIYFTRCMVDKKGYFGCKIYQAKKMGNAFGQEEAIAIGNDSTTIGHPALSSDDKTLIFAADLEGGYGGKDLWYTTLISRSKGWSEPINLGSDINTKGDEMFPYIKEDGTLYFASDGLPGMGGLDIFSAESLGENKWGNPQNMKSPINSNANDFGIIFNGNQNRGYFTTSRQGGKGEDDIWSFSEPPLFFKLNGLVKNLETGEPLVAATVTLIGTDGTTAEAETDAAGTFEFADNAGDPYIKPNTSYSISVTKPGFLKAKGNETTVDIEESKQFSHLYELQPITKDPIKLPEILYEFNKTTLTQQAKDSLNYLYGILVDNPNIVIELKANTDSRGSGPYNLKLSQGRAESAVNYLVSLGIAEDRMVPKGYGENALLITDAEINAMATEEEREAAHQLNRRTEFSILRTDYIPKNSAPTPKMDQGTPQDEVPTEESTPTEENGSTNEQKEDTAPEGEE